MLFTCCLFISISSIAQSPATLYKKAEKAYAQFKYAEAIGFYKNYLKSKKIDKFAFYNLAQCYKNLSNYDSALLYFQIASQSGIYTGNEIPELYANLGQYEKAIVDYDTLNSKRKSNLYDQRISGFKNRVEFLGDSLDYALKGASVNTRFNEYAAVPYKGGFVFESNRIDSTKKRRKGNIFGWDGGSYSKLYYNNGVDSAVSLFSKIFKGASNFGSISFTSDGKFAYYTRNSKWRSKNGVYQLQIWESKFENGKWKRGKKLFINNSKYSFFHPAISEDGKKLFYVSDQAGGMGGTDIYFIERNNEGNWKLTQNKINEVNTYANELFPTFFNGQLYFSSNGHPGIGGLDIFKLSKNVLGNWEVLNMGYPINSPKDDFTFYMNDNNGFLSTNRKGNDDIFSFEFNKTYLDVLGKVTLDSGILISSKVYLAQNDAFGAEKIIDSSFVDSLGNYNLKARPNKKYNLFLRDNLGRLHKSGFETNTYKLDAEKYKQFNAEISIARPIEQIKVSENKNIIVENKLPIKKFARAIDSLSTLTNDIVILHHPFNKVYVAKDDLKFYFKLINRTKNLKGKRIVIVSASDCKGTEKYNDKLSKQRAYNLYKSISKISENEVIIKPVGELELINNCDGNVAEQKINRYSYVFIIDK